jgi:hypothetical protein
MHPLQIIFEHPLPGSGFGREIKPMTLPRPHTANKLASANLDRFVQLLVLLMDAPKVR